MTEQKRPGLSTISSDSELTQNHLRLVDRHRRMSGLMRVDPNRRDHHNLLRLCHKGWPWWTLLITTSGCFSAFASYEPHHDRSHDGQTVRYEDTTKAPGTSRVTPVETPKLRNTRSAAPHIINQAHIERVRPCETRLPRIEETPRYRLL
jgi:hypothetical protein